MSDDSALEQDPLQTVEWQKPDSPSAAVIREVSDLWGADPIEMDPLYNHVDPDALDRLLKSNGPRQAGNDVKVEFQYQDYRIILHAHGKGYVYEQGANAEINSTPMKAQDD